MSSSGIGAPPASQAPPAEGAPPTSQGPPTSSGAPPALTSRASAVGYSGVYTTIILIDISGRPLMNLHRVPLNVFIADVKNKISERLKEVGRNLPADLMILKYIEEEEEIEMKNEDLLSSYNKMSLSKIKTQISKRHKFDINVIVIKGETKCLCIKKSAREEYPFMVRVPSNCYVKQLRMEIARRMNCGVDRHDVELFFDADLQEHVLMEGTCRAQEIGHLGTIYTKCPLNFNINNLAPLEVPREETAAAAAAAGDTAAAQQQQDATAAAAAAAAADNKTAADILTESTEAEEEKGAPKSAMQIDFEKTAGKSLKMSAAQAASFARKLGYSPGIKDCNLLGEEVDYKNFQSFLTAALHAEDLAESFQQFFALFDTQATGDLSAKQLCNIVQMYGDEPLTKEEAKKFTEIVMGNDKVLPINVVVDRIMEGQV